MSVLQHDIPVQGARIYFHFIQAFVICSQHRCQKSGFEYSISWIKTEKISGQKVLPEKL